MALSSPPDRWSAPSINGIFRLGLLLSLSRIPWSLIYDGIALVVFSSQIKDLLGLQIAEVLSIFGQVGRLFLSIHTVDFLTATVGIGS